MLANGFTAFLVWILPALIRANWLNRNIIAKIHKTWISNHLITTLSCQIVEILITMKLGLGLPKYAASLFLLTSSITFFSKDDKSYCFSLTTGSIMDWTFWEYVDRLDWNHLFVFINWAFFFWIFSKFLLGGTFIRFIDALI